MAISGILLSGCLSLPPSQLDDGPGVKDVMNRKERFRTRPPIRTTRNLYEGGLWRGASSWGNLMRDHRARYRGDLLTVKEMPKIINIPEPQVEPVINQPEQAAQPDGMAPELIDPLIAYLREREKIREKTEREQNEILRSIDAIEVEVVRVLPNGNLLVKGIHPPVFRDRNQTKYIVTLQGIVRPSDVDDRNSISASKLSKAEYKIKRLRRRSAALASQAASAMRAAGARRQGKFLDRLSGFLINTRPRTKPAATP